jgi:hypothetical protein
LLFLYVKKYSKVNFWRGISSAEPRGGTLQTKTITAFAKPLVFLFEKKETGLAPLSPEGEPAKETSKDVPHPCFFYM